MQITPSRFTSSLLRPQSRREIFEASNLAFHSNNQWCWCSSSAPVCSDSFSPQPGRKKLTKQERSVLVLAFVEKYMASNGGKFPKITVTRKQVGGSHYIIRSIIQELEYHHKRASLGTKKEVKISEENERFEVFPLTAEPCILTDANHKTASSESKKEVMIKEENDKSGIFPFTVEPCTSADTDQNVASLEVKKEVEIRVEIDKCEDFPSSAEPCILVDTKQPSSKEHVKDDTKPLTAEPCILTDANHKTASLESKKEVMIKEEKDKSGIFPFAVEPCTSADTDQNVASLEVKKEVEIRVEIDKCEDFPSSAEPCILVDTKQPSFKEHVKDDTKIRMKHPRSNRKIDTKISRSSIDAHSDDQIETNTHKLFSPSKTALHSSTPSAMETVKQQAHTSSGISANAENPVSTEFQTETFILRTAAEKRKVSKKDANLQGDFPERKKTSSSRKEVYHSLPERTEHKTAAATDGPSFWSNLKSMAVGIINLWKK